MSNIIIEGADGTGKSTLAKVLGEKLRMEIQESEGPPKSYDELKNRIARYNKMTNTVFVRHPTISNPIYDQLRTLDGQTSTGTHVVPLPPRTILIYCQHRDSQLIGHVVNKNDTEEHLRQVNNFYPKLCALYDDWARVNAHLFYKIGNNPFNLIDTVRSLRFDPVADLQQFHEHFDLAYTGLPRMLPEDLATFRQKFLQEELDEYTDFHMAPRALEHSKDAVTALYLENQIDALCDLMYVALGNAHLQGFDMREAWRRVHAANMTKVRATSADQSKRGSAYDVVKPVDFKRPSHFDLVRDNAHRQERAQGKAMGSGS